MFWRKAAGVNNETLRIAVNELVRGMSIRSISLGTDTAHVVAVSLGVVVRVTVVQVLVPRIGRVIIVLRRRPEVVACIRQTVPLLSFIGSLISTEAKYELCGSIVAAQDFFVENQSKRLNGTAMNRMLSPCGQSVKIEPASSGPVGKSDIYRCSDGTGIALLMILKWLIFASTGSKKSRSLPKSFRHNAERKPNVFPCLNCP